MPASPVPVLFAGSGLVTLARQYGASIIVLLNESSGTTAVDYSGNGNTITIPGTHITYRNPTVAQGVTQSVGYDGSQTASIVGPATAAGSFTAIQFIRISSLISNVSNYPVIMGTDAVSYHNQGWAIGTDVTTAGPPWPINFSVGYAASQQSGSTSYTQISAASQIAANTDYMIAATYTSATKAMAAYVVGVNASSISTAATGTATSPLVASATGIMFGDGITLVTVSHMLGNIGPGLYFPSVLTNAQIAALARFLV